jgi:hypothetical protein
MSQVLGNELTADLMSRLDGRTVESYEGKIIPIFTVDEYGWPHPALLSYYEMVAKNPRTIDMALWKNSSTANNLRQSGKVTLMMSDHSLNYYLKGTVIQTEAEMSGTPAVSRFRVTLEQVIEDQEPNAQITSGLTYRRMTHRDPNDYAAKVFRGLKERQ